MRKTGFQNHWKLSREGKWKTAMLAVAVLPWEPSFQKSHRPDLKKKRKVLRRYNIELVPKTLFSLYTGMISWLWRCPVKSPSVALHTSIHMDMIKGGSHTERTRDVIDVHLLLHMANIQQIHYRLLFTLFITIIMTVTEGFKRKSFSCWLNYSFHFWTDTFSGFMCKITQTELGIFYDNTMV